jgi:hypothetical protein
MRRNARAALWSVVMLFVVSCSVGAQIYRYYKPGTIWTVSAIRIRAGMDQAYLQYLDAQLKKNEDAQVKAGYEKSYRLLRTLDDDASSWNLLILREFPSLASLEANEEKVDELTSRIMGDDQAQMKGYEDRSKVREILWTKTARELVLK